MIDNRFSPKDFTREPTHHVLTPEELKALPGYADATDPQNVKDILFVRHPFGAGGEHAVGASPVSASFHPGNPTDGIGYSATPNIPLFSPSGPSIHDIHQGQIGDCYFLGSLAGIAFHCPENLAQLIVEETPGNYRCRYIKNGIDQYIYEDDQLPSNMAAVWDNSKWVGIYEKSWCFERSGANTYASIDMGNPYQPFTDLGFTVTAYLPGPTAWAACAIATARGMPWSVLTPSVMPPGVPLTTDHSLAGVSVDAAGNPTVYDPWGWDGAGGGTIGSDGTIPLTAAQANAGTDYVVVSAAYSPPTKLQPTGPTMTQLKPIALPLTTAGLASCKLEIRGGRPDIGFLPETAGGSAMFTTSTPGGTLTLTGNYSAIAAAMATVSINGVNVGTLNFPSTGSWDVPAPFSARIDNVPAGSITLTISHVAGPQYNLFDGLALQ